MNAISMKRIGREAKSWLFVVHRWMGIILCTLIAIWFASGLVMLYVGYPALTAGERLSHLPELRPLSGCCVSLTRAWASLPGDYKVTSIKFAQYGERHVFTFSGQPGSGHPGSGQPGSGHSGSGHSSTEHHGSAQPDIVAVSAESGERIQGITEADALRSARNYSPGSDVEYRGLTHRDTWLRGHGVGSHHPLHRIQTNDSAGTRLYISSVTGEVVRDATAVERSVSFIGAWLHWFYFIRDEPYWRTLLIVLACGGLFLVISGATAGTIRWRFRGSYGGGRKTPYREFYYRWHHISGLIFALIVFSWLFSGLMSLNPFRLMHSDAPPLNLSAYAGGSLQPERFDLSVEDLLRSLPEDFSAREVEWRITGGKPYLVAYNDKGEGRIRFASGDQRSVAELPEADVIAAAGALIPGHRIVEARRLSDYDFYYYARAAHTLYGDRARPLPVVRVTFDDQDRSIVYIDPRSGRILGYYNREDKQARWFFRLFHSWDLPGLLSVRPLWDILVISLLGGGVVLSTTGAVLGWRRLRLTLKR